MNNSIAQVFENSLLEFYIVDAESLYFMYANRIALENLGYTLDELRQIKIHAISPQYTEEIVRDMQENIFGSAGQYAVQLSNLRRRKDGSLYPVDLHIQFTEYEGRPAYFSFAFRSSEHQRELDQLRQVLRGSKLGYWDFNNATGKFFLDDVWLGMLGYTQEDVNNDLYDWYRFVHPDDREYIRETARTSILSNQDYHAEFRMIHKEGHIVWVQSNGSVVSWDHEKNYPLRVCGTHLDITRQKLAEEELFQQERMHRALVENSHDMILVCDRDLRCLYVNPEFRKSLGMTNAQFLGKTSRELGFPEDLCAYWDEKFTHAFNTGEPANYTYEAMTNVGISSFSWQLIPGLRDEKGEVTSMFSVTRDISKQKDLEDELQKMERLRSIGVLAGGIAHDFNNILTILFGNISMIKSTLADPEKCSQHIENAEKAFQRASHLTSQLLTFAKGGDPVLEDLGLTDLVKSTVNFDLSGSNVSFRLEAPDDLWKAKADKGQITQVFSNLTINANQAMPQGGKLTIRLDNLMVASGELPGLSPGKYIRAAVQDEGEGMDENIQQRIFDPFFSTKQNGSGLGLATVYSIITKHGGNVSVSSSPGTGACFTLYLPASENQAVNEDLIKPVVAAGAGTGRILVMDDEDMIRDLARAILERDGYAVDQAADGETAVARYRDGLQNGKPYDCVLMDLTIPGGMGGEEAIKEILTLDPKARAIVSSGYAVDPVMANFPRYGFMGMLMKPFTIQALKQEVQRVISETDA